LPAYTTDAELLQAVRNQLRALADDIVQSYSVGRRSVTRKKIDELREWERELVNRIEYATSGGYAYASLNRPA